jgi:hypothetical protein
MSVIQGYTQSLLAPQLQSLGLNRRQRLIVVEDVTQRLESLLAHWHDLPFRRAILVLGTEEAAFWEPRTADREIRSLVVVTIRNSLITDLNASRAYTVALRSRKERLPDRRMPWITAEAAKFFQEANLELVKVQPARDLFGSLPRRFPNAWHVLSLLGSSSDNEIPCELPMAQAEPMDFSRSQCAKVHTEIESGIDPGLNDFLVGFLKKVERGEANLFFSSAFKGITRNPEKLLAIIDHILRFGGTVLTPNYLLSPGYVARRSPLLRPAHYTSEIAAQIINPVGLTERHKEALALMKPDPTPS